MSKSLYDRDFYEWTSVQADLLRTGRLSEADRENLAEEIESIGQSQKSELRCRLRSRSWTATLLEQRGQIEDLLSDSPSLRPAVTDLLPRAYARARGWALTETGLLALPEACEWTADQVLNPAYLPD